MIIKAHFTILRFNLYAQGYILILIKNTAEWKKLEVSMSKQYYTDQIRLSKRAHNSMINDEYHQIIGVIFYWTWVSWMLSHCLSWSLLISCLLLSHAIAGILHVQVNKAQRANDASMGILST